MQIFEIHFSIVSIVFTFRHTWIQVNHIIRCQGFSLIVLKILLYIKYGLYKCWHRVTKCWHRVTKLIKSISIEVTAGVAHCKSSVFLFQNRLQREVIGGHYCAYVCEMSSQNVSNFSPILSCFYTRYLLSIAAHDMLQNEH